MFWDYQAEYASSSQSSCPSMSTRTFGSNSVYDLSDIRTPPPSTRRSSLDSLKLEDTSFSPANTREHYENCAGISSISSMHNIGPGIPDQNIMFPDGQLMQDQTLSAFSGLPRQNNNECLHIQSFQSNHGLSVQTPALEMHLISPISGVESYLGSMDFVDPSQTTFISGLDVDSPLPLMRPLQFGSPASEYSSHRQFELSQMANMSFHLQYEECKSTSTTPSRTSATPCRNPAIRQPMFEAVKSSAALQRAQAESPAARRTRKKLQRELCGDMLLSNVRIQHAADKKCLWPNCDKKFKRQEHLKRHEKIHTYILEEDSFPCEFCHHLFNRSDNLKSHLELHTRKDNQKRTKYFPGALAAWKALDSKKKKRSKTEDRVKIEPKVKVEARTRSRLNGY